MQLSNRATESGVKADFLPVTHQAENCSVRNPAPVISVSPGPSVIDYMVNAAYRILGENDDSSLDVWLRLARFAHDDFAS